MIPLDLSTGAPAMHCVDTLAHATSQTCPMEAPVSQTLRTTLTAIQCRRRSACCKGQLVLAIHSEGEPLIFVIRIESTYDAGCDINQANGRPAGRGDATAAIEMFRRLTSPTQDERMDAEPRGRDIKQQPLIG